MHVPIAMQTPRQTDILRFCHSWVGVAESRETTQAKQQRMSASDRCHRTQQQEN